MQPQYLAVHCSRHALVEALESHSAEIARAAYLFTPVSPILGGGRIDAAINPQKGQGGRFRPGMPLSSSVKTSRRIGCQRASRAFLPSAWSPLWRPVPSKPRKNMLWSIPSRSRSSLPTQVNSSNHTTGQALRPASPRALPLSEGGAVC